MNKTQSALRELHTLDNLAARRTFFSDIHPLAKLIGTVYYILLVVSFPKYDLAGLLSMAVVLLFWLEAANIRFSLVLRKLRVLFGLLFLVGILNPLFDRTIVANWGPLAISGGMFSCLTLWLKGSFALIASYLLTATTGMENICYALQTLHCPPLLITVVMLIYRYILLLLQAVDRLSLAYALRAPRQKGIHFSAWGSLAGSLLLRSVDRAELVYESMLLRGFQGTFYLQATRIDFRKSLLYIVFVVLLLSFLRIVPVFSLVGGVLCR